ncbi:type II secretion system F family protein [Nesterenkonia muleiensis]|uniref:type II secretion system F family protein n=1 Tax=Nesterenkonia muleiensis TaxID=2282648 RepID=UPI000E724A68|nr:type II secretion system F family protein [Nesterenkonia muleiensis]
MSLFLGLLAFVCAAACVLLLVPALREATTSLRRAVSFFSRLPLLVRERVQARPAETRKEAAELLRQFAALLMSGRGEAQAWTDLRETWRRRAPDHQLTKLCAQVAAAEAAGAGTAEGLRRCLAAESDRDPELTRLLTRLVGVTRLSEQTGAPLSELVEQLASSVDDSAELAAAVQTATAGPKLTQLILSLLPVGGLALGQTMGADPLAMLFGGGLGLICLAVGLLFLGAGSLWSRRMIQSVMRHA